MQRRVWTAALVIASVWIATARVGMAQGLPGDFVGPYRAALDAMKQAYSQATVEGTVTTTYPLSGKSIARQFILRLSGNTSRIDAKVTAQKGMGAKVGGTDIFMAMPGASMQAYRSAGGKLANQPMGEDAYNEAKTNIGELCPVSFPYTMGTRGTILDMLQSGGTQITSFKRGKLDGEPMIQINYEQQIDPEGNYGPWKCTLHIAPEEGYSLRTFSRTAGQGDRLVTVSGSLSYSLNSRGVPLLSSFERTERRGSGQVTERQAITVSDFDTERPSPFIYSADGF